MKLSRSVDNRFSRLPANGEEGEGVRETRVQRLEKFPLNKYRRVDPNDEGTRGERALFEGGLERGEKV